MPKFLLTLTLSGDDVPIKVFDTEPEVRDFIAKNPPEHPRHAKGIVREACGVFSATIADSDAMGYRVLMLDDNGLPVKCVNECWSDAFGYGWDDSFIADEPFDPSLPLFREQQPAEAEWDTTGGGPVS